MPEQGFDVSNQLEAIHGKLKKDREWTESLGSQKEPFAKRFARKIFQPTTNLTSSIARSEFFVTPDQVAGIEMKINQVREFLFQYGQDFTRHPEYQELNRFSSASELDRMYRNQYWYAVGEFETKETSVADYDVDFGAVPGIGPDHKFRSYIAEMEALVDREKVSEMPSGDTIFIFRWSTGNIMFRSPFILTVTLACKLIFLKVRIGIKKEPLSTNLQK